MSTISRIKARVEAEVAARLIPSLLDRGVEYHCRKRTRTWCDCNYCRTKRIGTFEVSIVGQMYSHSPRYWKTWNEVPTSDEWEVWARIQAARKKKIEALRLKLKESKEE